MYNWWVVHSDTIQRKTLSLHRLPLYSVSNTLLSYVYNVTPVLLMHIYIYIYIYMFVCIIYILNSCFDVHIFVENTNYLWSLFHCNQTEIYCLSSRFLRLRVSKFQFGNIFRDNILVSNLPFNLPLIVSSYTKQKVVSSATFRTSFLTIISLLLLILVAIAAVQRNILSYGFHYVICKLVCHPCHKTKVLLMKTPY